MDLEKVGTIVTIKVEDLLSKQITKTKYRVVWALVSPKQIVILSDIDKDVVLEQKRIHSELYSACKVKTVKLFAE